MTIKDWTDIHPDDPFRVIMYTPAPDIMDEHGHLMIGGEGTSTIVFDSTVSGDFPPDLLWRDIITVNEGDDGIPELEFMPSECYDLF